MSFCWIKRNVKVAHTQCEYVTFNGLPIHSHPLVGIELFHWAATWLLPLSVHVSVSSSFFFLPFSLFHPPGIFRSFSSLDTDPDPNSTEQLLYKKPRIRYSYRKLLLMCCLSGAILIEPRFFNELYCRCWWQYKGQGDMRSRAVHGDLLLKLWRWTVHSPCSSFRNQSTCRHWFLMNKLFRDGIISKHVKYMISKILSNLPRNIQC